MASNLSIIHVTSCDSLFSNTYTLHSLYIMVWSELEYVILVWWIDWGVGVNIQWQILWYFVVVQYMIIHVPLWYDLRISYKFNGWIEGLVFNVQWQIFYVLCCRPIHVLFIIYGMIWRYDLSLMDVLRDRCLMSSGRYHIRSCRPKYILYTIYCTCRMWK